MFIPAFIIITLLFNSPLSILLPKLTDGPGAVEMLALLHAKPENVQDYVKEAVEREIYH